MRDADLLATLFGATGDFVLLLRSDRTIESANRALLARAASARRGVDFLETVPSHARERVLRDLVRAAGGEDVVVVVPHTGSQGLFGVEYRFFPVDGGRVGGIGRLRDDLPSDQQTLERARSELRAKTRMLDEIQLELTQVPFIDPATGVWNRMQVIERLTAEWSRGERYAHPLAVLLVRIEDLRDVKASGGAVVVDQILRSVAQRIKSAVRDHDVVGRYASDCFVVVAVEADATGAEALSRRLRGGVEREPIAFERGEMTVRLRIGGATNRSGGVEIMEDLFHVAEGALERAQAHADGIHVASS